METVTELLARNERFAECAPVDLPILPRMRTVILACPDQRVDPAHVLGLELGDAVVIRAAGGRVTPAVLQNLALLATIAAIEGADGGFELILMQHTDCGVTRLLGEEYADAVAAYLGVGVEELPAKSLGDPYAGVGVDLEELAANPAIPDRLSVSAVVYDVATGRAELVQRRSPLR